VTVTVVTDSSAWLAPNDMQRWSIRAVPLHVLVDGTNLRDGVDPVPHDVHDRAHVTTAGATPADLMELYRRALADSGGDGVVAVHLSAALSSTFGSAVRVVNSRSAAAGVGFVAMAAARAAADGADLDTVEAAARAAVPRSHAFIVVHRLDNLRRSGRIGTAASWLGTALSLKPLLCLDVDGRLVLSQRIRTASKAHAALVESVAQVVGDAGATAIVHHVDNPDGAAEVGAALVARLPQLDPPAITDMGPVLSIHVGGGAVGVCVTVSD
jgi:DegV family protein with EDD domain